MIIKDQPEASSGPLWLDGHAARAAEAGNAAGTGDGRHVAHVAVWRSGRHIVAAGPLLGVHLWTETRKGLKHTQEPKQSGEKRRSAGGAEPPAWFWGPCWGRGTSENGRSGLSASGPAPPPPGLKLNLKKIERMTKKAFVPDVGQDDWHQVAHMSTDVVLRYFYSSSVEKKRIYGI